MSAIPYTVAEEIPGLALIQEGQEIGRDIFFRHYLPTVTKYVSTVGLANFNNGDLTTQDHAIIILGDLVSKSTAFFKRCKFPNDNAMRAYLRKMVENHRNDMARKAPKAVVHEELTYEDGEENIRVEEVTPSAPVSRVPRPDHVVPLWQLISIAGDCIRELPSKDAQIMNMIAEGCSHEEIGSELKVNPKSVGALLGRARGKLKRIVTKRHPDVGSLAF